MLKALFRNLIYGLLTMPAWTFEIRIRSMKRSIKDNISTKVKLNNIC